MSKVKRWGESTQYNFWCPGCKTIHAFQVKPAEPNWDFNGDFDCPTVKPSIKVTMGPKTARQVCHFHITNGKIVYCGDCWHDKRNLTVEMKDLDEGETEEAIDKGRINCIDERE